MGLLVIDEIARADMRLLEGLDLAIHLAQRHFAVIRNVRPPLQGIVADEIIANARLFIKGLESQPGIRADQLHPLDRPVAACEYGLVGRHEQCVAGRTSEKLYARIGLAFQLLDDVLDVSGPVERTGKARGTDLLDGTVTLPYILARERDPAIPA